MDCEWICDAADVFMLPIVHAQLYCVQQQQQQQQHFSNIPSSFA